MSSIYYKKNEIFTIIRDGETDFAWIGVKEKCDKCCLELTINN